MGPCLPDEQCTVIDPSPETAAQKRVRARQSIGFSTVSNPAHTADLCFKDAALKVRLLVGASCDSCLKLLAH